jgi:hypothetical protein
VALTRAAGNAGGGDVARIANTTQNRDHASHAQNIVVFTPSMTGPSPKST